MLRELIWPGRTMQNVGSATLVLLITIAERCVEALAEAIDQARVISFLASSYADFIIGVTIDVTEGL